MAAANEAVERRKAVEWHDEFDLIGHMVSVS